MAEELTHEQERKLAVDLFNLVWTLLERPDRTPEQDDEMVNATHASCHHWSKVGTAANIARGEWQISRVYSVLERPEPAVHHAGRCLAYCENNPDELEDWDLPFAYEAPRPRPRRRGELRRVGTVRRAGAGARRPDRGRGGPRDAGSRPRDSPMSVWPIGPDGELTL